MEYAEEDIACPTTPEEWQEIAKQVGPRRNFCQTMGALGGKHIAIKNPKNGGSLYFNYKGPYSFVLVKLVDDDYKCHYENKPIQIY